MTMPLPETSSGLLIPRIFHRVWLGGPMPERERRFGETWAAHHPGWEMRLWTEENLPPLVHQELFDASPSYSQKSDFVRYELVHRHGGIYLDTDFECYRTIEPLLEGVRAFCAREDSERVAGGLIGAVPGHPFFAAVIAAMGDSLAWRPGRPPNETVGPQMLTRVFAEREAMGEEVPTVFDPELFYPYHWTEPHRAGEQFPNAYAAHHWTGSWHGDGAIAAVAQTPTGDGQSPATAVPLTEGVVRVVVDIDPNRFSEASTVVLAAVLEAARPVDGAEIALVVRGVVQITPELKESLSGIVTTVASVSPQPKITFHAERDGQDLQSAVRVSAADMPAEAAAAVVAVSQWATDRGRSLAGAVAAA